MQHTVKFLRVLGLRAKQPSVIATVDGHLVKWRPDTWTCDCDEADLDCPHIDAVLDHLDLDRVFAAPRRMLP